MSLMSTIYPVSGRTVNLKKITIPVSYVQTASIPSVSPVNEYVANSHQTMHIWTYDPADILDPASSSQIGVINGLVFYYKVRTTDPRTYSASHTAKCTDVPSQIPVDLPELWASYASGDLFSSSIQMGVGNHIRGLNSAAQASFLAAYQAGKLWSFGVMAQGIVGPHKVGMSNMAVDHKLDVYYGLASHSSSTADSPPPTPIGGSSSSSSSSTADSPPPTPIGGSSSAAG